jgi:hypothetical protein
MNVVETLRRCAWGLYGYACFWDIGARNYEEQKADRSVQDARTT